MAKFLGKTKLPPVGPNGEQHYEIIYAPKGTFPPQWAEPPKGEEKQPEK